MKRDHVIALATRDPDRARAAARTMTDPWFGCQAFAWVARYWPGADFEAIVDEGVELSRHSDDPYVESAVAAWPIRALLERQSPAKAEALVSRAIGTSSSIANFGSRSESLFKLYQATRPFDPHLWQPVLRALVAASHPALNWRQRRNLRDAILMMATDEPELASSISRSLPDERLRRVAEKATLASPSMKRLPRPFFWE